mmetsp:Transcript_139753/g.243389  ORF Transcript_139753/g.243389 Transcript_139753/m.243389 type:complete len:201 (+) Transcript_139753:86-688(+)
MKLLIVLLVSDCFFAPAHGASRVGGVPGRAAFLAKREREHDKSRQPWAYLPPPPMPPRAKASEVPGDSVVLPPLDNLLGMQPTASPLKTEDGLLSTFPPRGFYGWYNTIPPRPKGYPGWKDGAVDWQRYYLRCLGGPPPCPYTEPPIIIQPTTPFGWGLPPSTTTGLTTTFMTTTQGFGGSTTSGATFGLAPAPAPAAFR